MRIGQEVRIYNELAEELPDPFTIVGIEGDTVNLSGKDGRKVPVHRSRIISDNMRRMELAKKEETTTTAPKPVKKNKLRPYDLAGLATTGELWHKPPKEFSRDREGTVIYRESLAWVSADGTQIMYFNLYNGSLGKKGKEPKPGDVDRDDEDFQDLAHIRQYLDDKGYKPRPSE